MPGQQPSRKKTRKVLQKAVDALALAVPYLMQLTEADEQPDDASNHADRAVRSRVEEWRSWPGFRGDMVHREKEYLRHNDPPVTKLALAGHDGDGDSVKSIERRMEDYGLDPRLHWPPSTWPERDPRQMDLGGHLMAAILAGLFLTEMIDVVSDGKLNHAIKFAWELCQHVLSGQI
jgi:hypothetical protein